MHRVDVITSDTALHLPVLDLIALTHRHGALALIDGAHAPGQIDEREIAAIVGQADFFVGNSLFSLLLPIIFLNSPM